MVYRKGERERGDDQELIVAMVYRKGERERGDDQELIVGLSEPSLYAERNGKLLRSFQQRKNTIWIMYFKRLP